MTRGRLLLLQLLVAGGAALFAWQAFFPTEPGLAVLDAARAAATAEFGLIVLARLGI